MANLVIKFKNMCVFAMGERRSEAWFPKNTFHEPFLRDAGLLMPSNLASQVVAGQGMPLKGRIVSFLDGGNPLPAGNTELVGEHTHVLPHINRLLNDDLVLEPAIVAMTQPTLADTLFTKVVFSGGTMEPIPLDTPGGRKQWNINDQVSTFFCEDVIYSVPVKSSNVSLRLSPTNGGAPVDIPVAPSSGGDFVVSISSENLTGVTMMDKHEAVVFLTEFRLFQSLVSEEKLAAPFAFWPEFQQQTDPNGGPCMMVRLDLLES